MCGSEKDYLLGCEPFIGLAARTVGQKQVPGAVQFRQKRSSLSPTTEVAAHEAQGRPSRAEYLVGHYTDVLDSPVGGTVPWFT